MASQNAFHAQLKLLADQYELVCAENAGLRQALSLELRPSTSAGKRIGDIDEFQIEKSKNQEKFSTAVELSTASGHLPGMLDSDLESEGMDEDQADAQTKASTMPSPGLHVPAPDSPKVAQLAVLEPESSPDQAITLPNRKTLQSEQLDEDTQQGQALMLLLDIIPAVAIIVNGICTGVQTDYTEPEELWDALEYFFLTFFTLEIVIKVYLFGVKEFVWGRDWYWGWFDIFCVGAGLLEIIMAFQESSGGSSDESSGGGVGGLIKLLKLARLGRIIRLLKFKIFAELKSMITGVFTGMKVLLWAMVLLFLVVYMFGLTTRILFSNAERYPEFNTLPSAMFTVFRCFTDGCAAFDGTPLQERIRLDPDLVNGKTDILFFFGYILIYLFVTVGIFNLIMAVFIDNVNDGSIKKKQHYIGASADKMRWMLSERFKELCSDPTLTPQTCFTTRSGEPIAPITEDTEKPQTPEEFVRRSQQIQKEMLHEGLTISKSVFDTWLADEDANLMELFDDADIDVSMKFELFEVLDADLGGTLDFEEIITGLMKCRGPVSKVDIVSMGMKVRFMTQLVQDICEKVGCSPPQKL